MIGARFIMFASNADISPRTRHFFRVLLREGRGLSAVPGFSHR